MRNQKAKKKDNKNYIFETSVLITVTRNLIGLPMEGGGRNERR